MASRRITFDEWYEEKVHADPTFARLVSKPRTRPRRRKVDLLIDESLDGMVEDLKTVRDFRVHTEARRRSDENLWKTARRNGWLIVTKDLDFWDDSNFPLRLSPGVVILRGRTLKDYTYALVRFAVHWGLLARTGQFGVDALDGFKARAARLGIEWKWFDEGTVVTDRMTWQASD